ncbi:MAG TPA: hypothetical protein ENI08_02250 [Candidatus Dependentiae bacterium]|nr:hypothetical protein [Candidatus Dependentiae bacterium]
MPLKDKQKRSEYHKKYMREVWYPKNKERHWKLIKARKYQISEYINNIKKEAQCADCGVRNKEHPEIFDFDHLGDDKDFCIGTAKSIGYGIEKIEDEIKKCEIVCSNCHRIRTKKRRKNIA